MKRLVFLTFVGLTALTMMLLISCGGEKPPVQEEVPVDTTPAVVEEPVTPPPPPPPPPKPILKASQLRTVYFDFDKYNLRPDAKEGLDHNYQMLKDFPDAMIRIQGHCDERGTIEYNLSLGEKRARACMDYLVGLGIDAGRLTVISYGEERPAVQGHNEDAWSKNRRAEFEVVSQ